MRSKNIAAPATAAQILDALAVSPAQRRVALALAKTIAAARPLAPRAKDRGAPAARGRAAVAGRSRTAKVKRARAK